MRKALCFTILALFLAVSMASSIHAASYPPDAPLPRFMVTKVEGNPTPEMTAVYVRFQAEQTNFEEWASYWEAHSEYTDWRTRHWNYRLAVEGNRRGEVDFVNGMAQVPLGFGNTWVIGGQWTQFHFSTWNYYTTFEPQIYLCDVYAPLPSDLPVGVWTDLQFKQTSQTILPFQFDNQSLVVVGIAVVAVLIVAFDRRKKRK